MFLTRLFARKPQVDCAPAAIPAGQRVYAIGDIHGRDDLFAELLDAIASDDAARGVAETSIILLGDLVDRGPSSRQVVERAMRLRDSGRDAGTPMRWLLGNHEEMFLTALGGDPQHIAHFIRAGGGQTMRSYGLSREELNTAPIEEIAQIFPSFVPGDHIAFLAAGEDSVAVGDYLFVHAGVRPGIALDQQKPSDLRWIRREFLDDPRDHGRMIIHGHTITAEPDERHNRIGIDTGAYESGRLTAIGLEGAGRWYISTGE